jgi:hypothetical protein
MPDLSPRSRLVLRRYATSYEVIAELPTGVLRLGFTARPSRAIYLSLARSQADAILPYVTDDDMASYTAAGGLRLGLNVLVRTSGRTERQCADDAHCSAE